MSRKKNDKLHIYCAEGDPDYGCAYIAALTSKEAKQIALGLDVAQCLNNPYIELRVTLCKYAHCNNITKPGELSITQINDAGLTWWCCPECNGDNFEILDLHTYRCKDCNHEDEIPYIC